MSNARPRVSSTICAGSLRCQLMKFGIGQLVSLQFRDAYRSPLHLLSAFSHAETQVATSRTQVLAPPPGPLPAKRGRGFDFRLLGLPNARPRVSSTICAGSLCCQLMKFGIGQLVSLQFRDAYRSPLHLLSAFSHAETQVATSNPPNTPNNWSLIWLPLSPPCPPIAKLR